MVGRRPRPTALTPKRLGLVALACAAAVLASSAAAQYSRAPFFEQSLMQSQGYGIELSLQRLDALELAAEEGNALDDDFMEIVEGFEDDLPRFIGTLRARNAALAGGLEEAIEAVEDAAASGSGLAAAIGETRDLLNQAYEVVIPADVRADPVFVAGLIVNLSLGEGGVGEGYEEAIEGELGEFTMGYAATQRVSDLWREIAGDADEQQRTDFEEMLKFVKTLYPEPIIEEAIVGNPEEAEAPVQRMLGVLETVVDAELFAGRDLAALAAHLPAELAVACQAYEAGESERAKEIAIGVGGLYLGADLGDFLEFMAPEVHEKAYGLIGALTGMAGEGAEDVEGGEEGASEAGDEGDEEEIAGVEDPATACRELQEALQEASSVLGG